jgi:hypothetical protein
MMTDLTFRQIENSKGIAVSNDAFDSSLSNWYQDVRDKPIDQFMDKDFGIACRQQVYMEFVVPVLLSRLKSEPLAGDMYDGELLIAIAALPKQFWTDNTVARNALRTFLDSIVVETNDEDITAALHNLRSKSL